MINISHIQEEKVSLAQAASDARASMEALNLRIKEDQADREAHGLQKKLDGVALQAIEP